MGHIQNKRKYRVQFFDATFNLVNIPEDKVQEFIADGVEESVPDKLKEEWKKGMDIAAKAIENPLDDSDASDKASSSMNSGN